MQALFLCQLLQFFRLLDVHCHRLVAGHMNAVLQKCLGNRKMRLVRRRNDDKVNPILAGTLFLDHLFVVGIQSIAWNMPLLSRRLIFLCMSGKTARRHDCQIVHLCAAVMDIADKRADAAAYHAKPKMFHRLFLLKSINFQFDFSFLCFHCIKSSEEKPMQSAHKQKEFNHTGMLRN